MQLHANGLVLAQPAIATGIPEAWTFSYTFGQASSDAAEIPSRYAQPSTANPVQWTRDWLPYSAEIPARELALRLAGCAMAASQQCQAGPLSVANLFASQAVLHWEMQVQP